MPALFSVLFAGVIGGGACSSSEEAVPPAGVDAGTDAAPPPPALVPDDVSILYPAPTGPREDGYLVATSEGPRGMLLTREVFDAIPRFPVDPADGLVYDRMVVLAVRFDACFPAPSGCEAQVRLVLQPVTAAGLPRDSALHAFYTVPEGEVATMVRELRRLHALAPEAKADVLDVHPSLVAHGATGAYGIALRELVLRYAGDATLTRVTFFLRAPPAVEVWSFGGFDRVDGKLVKMPVVGVSNGIQGVTRPETGDGYEYQLSPAPKVPEDVTVLLSSAAAAKATPEARAEAAAALARLENPRVHVVDAQSCAGCHIGTVVGAHLAAAHGIELAKLPDAFPSRVRATTKAATTPSSLRAFGYFQREPMISTRMVNETEDVLEDIAKRFGAP